MFCRVIHKSADLCQNFSHLSSHKCVFYYDIYSVQKYIKWKKDFNKIYTKNLLFPLTDCFAFPHSLLSLTTLMCSIYTSTICFASLSEI